VIKLLQNPWTARQIPGNVRGEPPIDPKVLNRYHEMVTNTWKPGGPQLSHDEMMEIIRMEFSDEAMESLENWISFWKWYDIEESRIQEERAGIFEDNPWKYGEMCPACGGKARGGKCRECGYPDVWPYNAKAQVLDKISESKTVIDTWKIVGGDIKKALKIAWDSLIKARELLEKGKPHISSGEYNLLLGWIRREEVTLDVMEKTIGIAFEENPRLYRVWIVTQPTYRSTLGDILFSANWEELRKQYLGGLGDEKTYAGNRIVAVFDNKPEAERLAIELLAKQTKLYHSTLLGTVTIPETNPSWIPTMLNYPLQGFATSAPNKNIFYIGNVPAFEAERYFLMHYPNQPAMLRYEDRQNESPTMREMVNITKKYDGRLFGYVIPFESGRPDAGIIFDGFVIRVSKTVANRLKDKYRPDEFNEVAKNMWRFWWD
jgi:hypothetical protein